MRNCRHFPLLLILLGLALPQLAGAQPIISQLIVDFSLTETLLKAADPSLTQAIIDQGLADLELRVSPGVDLTAFAPQFPQAPPAPAVPALSLPGPDRIGFVAGDRGAIASDSDGLIQPLGAAKE